MAALRTTHPGSCSRSSPRAMGLRGHCVFFFFQAEDGIRDVAVTGVQTCALPILTLFGLLLLDVGVLLLALALALTWRRQFRSQVAVREMVLTRRHAEGVQAVLEDRKSVGEGKSVDLGGRRII